MLSITAFNLLLDFGHVYSLLLGLGFPVFYSNRIELHQGSNINMNQVSHRPLQNQERAFLI